MVKATSCFLLGPFSLSLPSNLCASLPNFKRATETSSEAGGYILGVISVVIKKKKPSKVAELVNCISNTAVMSLLCAYLCTFGSLSKKQVIAL